MDDPYNTKVKPDNFWINQNCELTRKKGWKYRNSHFYDKFLFRFNNKCKMLNNKWRNVPRENIKKGKERKLIIQKFRQLRKKEEEKEFELWSEGEEDNEEEEEIDEEREFQLDQELEEEEK